MNKFKGTKGKWDWSISPNSNGFAYVNNGGIAIYGSQTKKLGTVSEETKANAKLIAAAPEMLEALENIIKEYDLDIVSGIDALKIRELINKATTI